jgi:Ni,Fe-hydrogenase I small subunit
MYPYIDELVLEVLSVEYHETIMAAAGTRPRRTCMPP